MGIFKLEELRYQAIKPCVVIDEINRMSERMSASLALAAVFTSTTSTVTIHGRRGDYPKARPLSIRRG